ncbi:hypothetical protein RMSM_00136 [Rhodopirellula maiorica SM1]|uniref:Uncharacterized protein n=1 Tax=Rhodopirellula maiorica SM1 TaxID=1265738 RepID=M5S5K3_9BACT|nr:hypothetical protein RMSM_00136 [Rhodopirellula maiorica SM1]
MNRRANGPVVCSNPLTIPGKWLGRWPFDSDESMNPARWAGRGKLLGRWPGERRTSKI